MQSFAYHKRNLIKWGIIIVFISLMWNGCSTSYPPNEGRPFPSPTPTPEPTPPERHPSPDECLSVFLEGQQYYEYYKQISDPFQLQHFFMAIDLLTYAAEACSHLEYEDDSLFKLANSYFYIGDYSNAARYFLYIATYFPTSYFNQNNFSFNEAQFLQRCQFDTPAMEFYRRGELYELHQYFPQARDEYNKALANSTCQEIRERSQMRIQELSRY